MRLASLDALRHHSELALPGIFAIRRIRATQRWQCQGFPAKATQRWQCQGLLASDGFLPLSAGSARDLWRAEGFHHPVPDIKKSSLAGAFKFIWWTVGGSNPGPWD